MNVREVEDAGHTAHQSVWESLPWYANGTLEHGEHALVERHLANCVTCRSELNYLRQLGRLVHGSEDYVPSPSRGLEEVLSRIESGQTGSGKPRGGFWTGLRRTSWLWRGALLAQAALILVLLSLLVIPRQGQPENIYRTLSDSETTPAASVARLRVVFDEQSPEREIRKLLHSVGGEIVAGPSPTGVYTLKVELTEGAAHDPTAVADDLRSKGKGMVRFAEPVTRERSRN